MKKDLLSAVFAISLIFLISCSQSKDFSYGLAQLNEANAKFGSNMSIYPNDIAMIDSLLKELEKIKNIGLDKGQEQFSQLITYRMLSLETQKYLINDSLNYGKSGSTKDGFGCKQRPLVIESVALRNHSAELGFESVSLLRNFAEKYPEEAKMAGVSYKDSVFLNATFFTIWEAARKDSNTINSFCPKKRVLELYQEEFRKKTNLSEEYISKLTYEEAVIIWKKIRSSSAVEIFEI